MINNKNNEIFHENFSKLIKKYEKTIQIITLPNNLVSIAEKAFICGHCEWDSLS